MKKVLQPEYYHFLLSGADDVIKTPLPKSITLLRPAPDDPSKDQLFIDRTPVPNHLWGYDAVDKVLSWKKMCGGGLLNVQHDGKGAVGVVGDSLRPVAVIASIKAHFTCDVALNCGALYTSSGAKIAGMTWDPNSDAWKNAAWMPGRLQISYTYTPGVGMMPPEIDFEFDDLQTKNQWIPDLGTFQGTIGLGQRDQQTVWNLVFQSSIPPDPDGDPNASDPGGKTSVFPYWLLAAEDAAAAAITGTMDLTGAAKHVSTSPAGFRGVRSQPSMTGVFQTAAAKAPFGVFDHALYVGEQKVDSSYVKGDTLHWDGLHPELQKHTGLPAKGQLKFSPGGHPLTHPGGVSATRLHTEAAITAIQQHPVLHPTVHRVSASLGENPSAPVLDIHGLMAMNCFAQDNDNNGAWYDQVQKAVTESLQAIMNSYIPDDMWGLIFPNMPKTILTADQAKAAATAVSDSDIAPSVWYQRLAAAVMVQGLAAGDDQYCQYLNGPRAAAWLKQEVAKSPVYYAHGQALFHLHWQDLFKLTQSYLDDQVANAGAYAKKIDQQVEQDIADIKFSVVPDPSAPDMIPMLIARVRDMGNYAKQNKLYWAFYYYIYNSAPGILANIGIQINGVSGNSDETVLSRLLQQNVAVLTALDPSGYFAKEYTRTVDQFLQINILPSMFSFNGDLVDFSVIKEYLQQFVSVNLKNEDKDIAAAAAQINELISGEQADARMRDWCDILVSTGEALQMTMERPSFALIADRFEARLQAYSPAVAKCASFLGSTFMMGVVGLNIFGLYLSRQNWDKMNKLEKAEVMTDALELGLQALGAVAKRGVRVIAVLSKMPPQARAAISVRKLIWSGEVAPEAQGALDNAIGRFGGLGGDLMKWAGRTGNRGYAIVAGDERAAANAEIELRENVADIAPRAAEAGEGFVVAGGAAGESLVAKVFGANLELFMVRRLGPVIILATVGYSIANLIEGESGVAAWAEGINAASGILMVIGILAPSLSFAGPLAIVGALVGVALMIYQLFETPPDPVQQFVDNFAAPAGFKVEGRSSSIDYATTYLVDDVLEEGFMLNFDPAGTGGNAVNNTFLNCNTDGSIILGPGNSMPSCVWVSQTDGLGISQLFAITQSSDGVSPVSLCLSLMSDKSIAFRPNGAPGVATQYWLSNPQGSATLAKDNRNLLSLRMTLQPVMADAKGLYPATGASGYLARKGSTVGWSQQSGDVLTLTMSGIAPNFMSMDNLKFLLGTMPSDVERFSPHFGILPSSPLTFSLDSDPPDFLVFDSKTGLLSTNGKQFGTAVQTNRTIKASNPFGSSQVNFTITVAAGEAAD